MLLGIDITSRDVAVILAKPDGGAELALRAAHPREGGAPAIWLAAMETARETMRRAKIQPAQIAHTALAFDNPVDQEGIVGKGIRTEGWEGFNLKRALQEHLGVADAVAENRVICEALGEWRFGALRPAPESPEGANGDWLYVHIGSTISGAATVNGKLVRGAARAAVELGAICIERDGALCASGRRGCLDGYCGGEAFMTRAASYGLTLRLAHEIWEMSGTNFAAQSLCEDYVQRLAQGLGIAVSLLNPARIVLGGGLANGLGQKLLVPLRARIQEFCLPAHFQGLEVVGAQLGEDAAALGAVALAMEKTTR